MARTSASPTAPTHYVVDGSNIATEGRAMPSLQQLNEAVLAFIEEHPDALITVVVDATFGHRIANNEVDVFDLAVANNELVTPPAGAVGRGDAFVLTIAHKAKAGILSNDSFQEFHGEYPWLFEPGRLIGGKPVPHVGWVFVERLPVRGPKSRQSVKDARTVKATVKAAVKASAKAARGSGSPLADQPLPVPTAPPPGIATAKAKRVADSPDIASIAAAAKQPTTKAVNELIPFLEFVEQHPVGTSATVVVESYASHGAYARAGDVLVYLPLRLMGSPAPRSARSAVAIGEAVAVVIAGYAPERRGIDAALPSAAEAVLTPAPPASPSEPAPPEPAPRKRTSKRAAATPEHALDVAPAPDRSPSAKVADDGGKSAATKRRGRKQAVAATDTPAPAVAAPAADAPEPSPATKRRTRKKVAAAAPAPDETAAPATVQATEPATTKRARKRVAEPAAGPRATPSVADAAAPTRRRKKAAAPATAAAPANPRKRAAKKATTT